MKMLREFFLFVSLGLHVLAKCPHNSALIFRRCALGLSTQYKRIQSHPRVSLMSSLDFRGGSSTEMADTSDSSSNANADVAWDGCDTDDDGEYGDPCEPYDSSEDETLAQDNAGLQMDIQYFMPSSAQLYITVGCMMMSSRIDFFNPTFVRLVRFAFIMQIMIQQFFVIYVRLVANRTGDTSTVDSINPAMDILMSQIQMDGNVQEMAKRLTSSFLSSQTTVMEYDLKQASDLQGGVIVNMILMWFLHFRLGKIQPLLMQVLMGFLQIVYSPLFQVYVLGRNLERPFKTQKKVLQETLAHRGTVSPSKEASRPNDSLLGHSDSGDDQN